MSNEVGQVSYTQHGLLVAWGRFAQEIGVITAIQGVKLKQKKYRHSPQSKVLEFLVANLAGLKQLQQISLAAHPLDKDQTVAEAWGQPGWADYSGVSRTLRALSWTEVEQLLQGLQQVSQPFVAAEIQVIREQGQRLRFDGDLTGLPVSNTSQSYPHAAYGHMADEIRLGYQASLVSLVSPTYGRLWLSVSHHPGDTVSCTQAEALVLAAEVGIGLRPRRRTELLQQRLGVAQLQLTELEQRLESQHQQLVRAQLRLQAADQHHQACQRQLIELAHLYQARQRPERPSSHLAKTRQRGQSAQRQCQSRAKSLDKAQQRVTKSQARLAQHQGQVKQLQDRLDRFEQDNATNLEPIEAEFRLDAGFGTYDNVALLIELGYELYTKPHSHQVVAHLKSKLTPSALWVRVGANAEMVAWPMLSLKRCPYPLDIALERFYTGKRLKYSALLHFGADPVTQDLVAWFDHYNGRQIIEAGIKEGKQVFYLHHFKVRSEPAIYLQEALVIFAANFIRLANHWLAAQALPVTNALDVSTLGIKKQVQVAAHVSAELIRSSEGWLLKFSQHSAFAGKVLKLPAGGFSPAPQTQKNVLFVPFLIEPNMIAQPLR
jgi:hypothetical protein